VSRFDAAVALVRFADLLRRRCQDWPRLAFGALGVRELHIPGLWPGDADGREGL